MRKTIARVAWGAGNGLLAVWALVMVWLVYLGFSDSFVSDEFFWWERLSIAIFGPALMLMIASSVIENHE